MTALLNLDGSIKAIARTNKYPICIDNSPFIGDLSTAFNYQFLNDKWVERTWSELQIIKTTYPLGQCIVELSNSDILTFECFASWTKADVIAAINVTEKYANTNIS